MRHKVFISYSNDDKDIVENLREQFKDLGVGAWVYSRDRILGENMWDDIERNIKESEVIIFGVFPNYGGTNNQEQSTLTRVL